ncbi:MAG: phosphatase PAP2 family protein [Thomasclavelia sp.]|nr:phosphatase PAP2 family protein [Thomasclavelia sp.]
MEEFYQKTTDYLRSKKLDKLILMIVKIFPFIIAIIYGVTLIHLYLSHSSLFINTVLIPLISFSIVTLIRKIIDRPRPFIKYDFEPLYYKKEGESFPSRHTVSAISIAVALFHVNMVIGIVVLILASLVALSRILSGVHYPSDVIVGILIALLVYIAVYLIN